MAVLLAKHALPRTLDAPPREVSEDLARLPAGFGQQSLEGGGASLDLKKLAGKLGTWRLRTGDWRSVFVRVGDDFLVVAIGRRKDIYERVERMRLARRAEGVAVIETRAPGSRVDGPRMSSKPARRVHRFPAGQQNPLSPFEDRMLLAIDGVDQETLSYVRALPASVDAPTAIADHVADPDLAFLLADIWERPQFHLSTYEAGSTPSIEGLEIEEAELAERLASAVSGVGAIPVDGAGQIRRVLDRSIEEWMVYLHPSQRAIAQAKFSGPARVRGGPGTGKTVVALHRARWLARNCVADEEQILLTTFLNTLPKVWIALMGLLDDKALQRLDIRNIDVIARDLAAEARDRKEPKILEAIERQNLVEPLLTRYRLDKAMAANPQLLLNEFDAFISGRGIDDVDDYLALRRRGGGSGLTRPDRERVFEAYEHYSGTLKKRDLYDWPRIRYEALRAAEAGAGPRYNGVIVDEAQDLSAVGMRLLLALDKSEDNRHLMIVGDGQQSIYPGGFSLREVGVDIVGRSRVLTANWRNTWNVWTAARAVIAGREFDDLDEDVGLRPTGEEPEPLTVGDPAELHVVSSSSEELDLLAELVADRIKQGVDPGDIAVLAETKKKGDGAIKVLEAAGVPTQRLERYHGEHVEGVLVGTFSRAKGLEFKEVFAIGLAEADWPSRWFVPPDLSGEARAERLAVQVRTLFVGLSRARDRLVLLSGGEPCEPVRQADWAFEVVEY